MAKALRVDINPEIIKWARETAGYSDEEWYYFYRPWLNRRTAK
ncbi:hypothetical protein [Thermodesulfovibrio sp. TK110]